MALAAIFSPLFCGFPIDEIGYGIYPDYSEGLRNFALDFKYTACELVPVRTGYLQSSISTVQGENAIYATAAADYAQYVEYGTWNMAAQPFFEPALNWAADTAYIMWYEELDNCMFQALLLAEEFGEEIRRMARKEGDAWQAMLYNIGDILYDEIIAQCEERCAQMAAEGYPEADIQAYREMMYELAEQTRNTYYAMGDDIQAQYYALGDHLYDEIVTEQETQNFYYEMMVSPEDPYTMII